jgi:hypothetical protein
VAEITNDKVIDKFNNLFRILVRGFLEGPRPELAQDFVRVMRVACDEAQSEINDKRKVPKTGSENACL